MKTHRPQPGALHFLPRDLGNLIMKFVGFPVVVEPASPLTIVPEWSDGVYGQYPVAVDFPLFA